MERELFYLKINGVDLDSIPVAKTAELIQAFADFIGADICATLKSVRTGSIRLESLVPQEQAGKFEEKAARLNCPGMLDPTVKQFIQKVCKVGGASAEIGRGKTVISSISNISVEKPSKVALREYSEVQGKLIGLRGADETKHALISHATGTWNAKCDEKMGKALAPNLWGYVKVCGPGRWVRDSDSGKWDLEYIQIDRFEVIEDKPLAEILDAVRKTEGFKPERLDDPEKFLLNVRG